MARKPAPYMIDDENPEWTAEEVAEARPTSEVLPPEVLADLTARRPRGRPRSDAPKVAIKLRLDRRVIAHFKTQGPGWQTRMNDALLKMVDEVPRPD